MVNRSLPGSRFLPQGVDKSKDAQHQCRYQSLPCLWLPAETNDQVGRRRKKVGYEDGEHRQQQEGTELLDQATGIIHKYKYRYDSSADDHTDIGDPLAVRPGEQGGKQPVLRDRKRYLTLDQRPSIQRPERRYGNTCADPIPCTRPKKNNACIRKRRRGMPQGVPGYQPHDSDAAKNIDQGSDTKAKQGST